MAGVTTHRQRILFAFTQLEDELTWDEIKRTANTQDRSLLRAMEDGAFLERRGKKYRLGERGIERRLEIINNLRLTC